MTAVETCRERAAKVCAVVMARRSGRRFGMLRRTAWRQQRLATRELRLDARLMMACAMTYGVAAPKAYRKTVAFRCAAHDGASFWAALMCVMMAGVCYDAQCNGNTEASRERIALECAAHGRVSSGGAGVRSDAQRGGSRGLAPNGYHWTRIP